MTMSILSAFNNAAIHRLKFTFAAISKKASKVLERLNECMSSSASYKSIRHLVTTAKPPCIPFLYVAHSCTLAVAVAVSVSVTDCCSYEIVLVNLCRGVYMSDLTFVEDGNPDRVHGNLINYRKRQLEYDIIVQLLAYQNQTYNLTMVCVVTERAREIV
jgi:hypothetical protein